MEELRNVVMGECNLGDLISLTVKDSARLDIANCTVPPFFLVRNKSYKNMNGVGYLAEVTETYITLSPLWDFDSERNPFKLQCGTVSYNWDIIESLDRL